MIVTRDLPGRRSRYGMANSEVVMASSRCRTRGEGNDNDEARTGTPSATVKLAMR